jgi:predicted chitinase
LRKCEAVTLRPTSLHHDDGRTGTGETVILTIDIMREMWPRGDTKIPGLVDDIVAAAPSVFPKYGLTSDLLVAHAMAQFSHESGAGNEVVENLNYSADGLMKTWPSRFDAAKAAQFAPDQQRIANEVYDGRMGNGMGTEDGWKYRGRGGSQVTGRDGYAALGQRLVSTSLASRPGQQPTTFPRVCRRGIYNLQLPSVCRARRC